MTALAPLATPDDLGKRGISVPDGMDAETLLASASDAVREAAGCPIALATSTVETAATPVVCLPGVPIRSVQTVEAGGDAVTGWTFVLGELRIPHALLRTLPEAVTVTYTHGLTLVPNDIVDLVCGMVSIAAGQSDGSYGDVGRVTGIRLGDYSEQRAAPAGADSPSPMALPDSVRDRLRARFGTSIAVVGVRR